MRTGMSISAALCSVNVLCGLSGLAASLPLSAWAQVADAQQVEIIGVSPLPGQGVDRAVLPYSTQRVRRPALDQAQADNMSDYLARRVPGMQVSDIQGSPFQGELSYRGFRASGLMGASQGLSVYLDGVRINEAFGDVVNWDLVPEFALDSLSVVPGANPAFGLNTLGGALAFTTTDGLKSPGTRVEFSLGQNHRQQLSLSHGGRGEEGWHHYLGASAFHEDGWRDHSAGRQGLALFKLGHDLGDQSWTTSLLLGRSRLIGNGLTPAETLQTDAQGDLQRVPDLLATRRSAIYTWPDETRHQLAQWQFNHHQDLGHGLARDGLVYLRQTRRNTLNGDVAEEIDPAEPALNAALNTTTTRQRSLGAALTWSGELAAHRWQAGLTGDAGQTRFQQWAQAGMLTASRGVAAGDDPAELSAAVSGHSLQLGAFASDTWQVLPGSHLTATLRANQARVSNTLTSVDEDTGSVEQQPRESFHYNSLNPALGWAEGLTPRLTVFGNLARNTRVPTVIELGCADPEQPCRLPAGLQSDPYLKQVRSVNAEAGMRWRPQPGQQLELTVFRVDNHDDIVFGSVSATSQMGYFRNVARTRHQGWELGWDGRITSSLTAQASWSRLDATYQVHDTLRMGMRNVEVVPGMRQAGLPRDTVKLGLDWQAAPGWNLGADWQHLSSRGVLGNEDGRVEDGEDPVASLNLPGYATLNLRARWQVSPAWSVSAGVTNLLDRRAASFGALGETLFDVNGSYTGQSREALFVAPVAPRKWQVAVQLHY